MNALAPIESVSVPEPQKPTYKQKKAMAEAAAFAKFGVHALRVKTKVLAALGEEAEAAGIRHIGNGKVIVVSGTAEESIARLGKLADKLTAMEKPDFELVVEVLRLLKEFNGQLLTTAQVHLNMAKGVQPESPSTTFAFPAGTPLMVAVGASPSAGDPTHKLPAAS